MLKWIETTGRSEEDAIAAALFQLGMDRDVIPVHAQLKQGRSNGVLLRTAGGLNPFQHCQNPPYSA